MPSLLVSRRGRGGEKIALPPGRLRIGRAPECDIVVDDDGVSRIHASLTCERSRCLLEDAGSRNGVFVNGTRVERAWLQAGDRVRLGQHAEMEYLADDAEAGDEIEEPTTRQAAPGPRASWWRETRWWLRSEGGGDRDIPILPSVVTVGRDPAAGLSLDDDSISRMHARVDRRGDTLRVTDLKSRNGTLVNDVAVMQAGLADGDRVRFGNLGFEVIRRTSWAWRRIGLAGAGLAALVAGAIAVGALGDWLGDRAVVAEAAKRLREQARSSVLQGIEAYERGDLDYARGYLVYAGDLLLLSNLAPPGTSMADPAALFRNLARDLPARHRGFDFSRALDRAGVAAQRARLEGLSNREFVERQVRNIGIELGQDANVPPGFIDQVWHFVDQWSRDAWFGRVLERSRSYQRTLRDLLADAHLPEAFCYVAWVESALVPTATSHVGARGLWQFMIPTGRQYGLRVEAGVDERTDVVKSTRAAAEYIGDLIRKFGREQFMCALASYNRGEGAVFRAMGRIPDPMMASSRKYWYLVESGLLPRETSEYVAKIFATRILAEDPERFGFARP